MKKLISSLVVLVVLVVIVAAKAGDTKQKHYSQSDINSLLLSLGRGEALGAMIVLTELREGRTNRALESLEFQIDNGVISAWHHAKLLTGKQKQEQLEFLRTIKAYRSKHPRKKEAKLEGDQPVSEELSA